MSGVEAWEDATAQYVATFNEWLRMYGASDACMEELRAAVLVALDREHLSPVDRDVLLQLLQQIDAAREVSERAA